MGSCPNGDCGLFMECKARRLSLGASLPERLSTAGSGHRQHGVRRCPVYKTIVDYRDGAYPHFSYDETRKVFPIIVTLENWHMFGNVMLNKLAEGVLQSLKPPVSPRALSMLCPTPSWQSTSLRLAYR
jgi:hypothetical protein